MERLMEFASSVPDFRRINKDNHRYRLDDILILIVLSRASKCVGRAEIVEFGKHNLERFRKMGILMNSVPSEPTLCRMEKGIDSLCMAERMTDFMDAFRSELISGRDIICVDGKAMRGTLLQNGHNPDIVSTYSFNAGITLSTEACQEKSNEIKAIPLLLDKLDIGGDVVTADAMSMQKEIIDKIRQKNGDFVIELKANQRSLRYAIEDRIKTRLPLQTYTEDALLGHGRIETRTYRVYDGLELVADKEKWCGNLTVVEFESDTVKKSTGTHACEKRLYVSSLPADASQLGAVIRSHWSMESMHWALESNFLQDKIKRKSMKAAGNLDTLQRIVHALFSIWRGRRKKLSDKEKGIAELMRGISRSFTKLMRFLSQK